MAQNRNNLTYPMAMEYLHRTSANDKAGLKRARQSLKIMGKRRKSKSKVAQISEKPGKIEHTAALSLQPRYDGRAEWEMPHQAFASGARRWIWGGVGFPEDKSIVLDDFENKIHIDTYDFSIEELAQDILAIKEKAPGLIADGHVKTEESFGRKIETFQVNKRNVVKIKLEDADILKGAYSKLKIAKEFESKVNEGFMTQPDLGVEQYISAEIILRMGGAVPGSTRELWKNTRMLAQQQLYVNPQLIQSTKNRLKELKDPTMSEMLRLAKCAFYKKGFNQYYQAQRDQHAVEKGIFYYVKDADIILILDRNNRVILFQCSDAIQKLLSNELQEHILDSFRKYSVLHAVPLPDGTRHGLHWTDWLKEHPEFDYRNPENDLQESGPQSGVYHFGSHSRIGDSTGVRGLYATQDSSRRIKDWPHLQREQVKLRYSAFGAVAVVLEFFFKLLDPQLMKRYQKVAEETGTLDIPFQTQREGQVFCMTALLVNILTVEHKDASDWKFGLAALIPVGEFTGGDLLLRELGLQIRAPSGSVQFLRGCELRHSITRWNGTRFVTVNVTHQSVRKWAELQIKNRETENQVSPTKGPKRTYNCEDDSEENNCG